MQAITKAFLVTLVLVVTNLFVLSVAYKFSLNETAPSGDHNLEMIVLDKGVSVEDYIKQQNEKWNDRVEELKKRDQNISFRQESYLSKKNAIYICVLIWMPIIYFFKLNFQSTIITATLCFCVYLSGLLAWFELFSILVLLLLIHSLRKHKKIIGL